MMNNTATGTVAPLSMWAQGRLDKVLDELVADLRRVIPEHEIVLSLAVATRSALYIGVPERELPHEVDSAVRSMWGLTLRETPQSNADPPLPPVMRSASAQRPLNAEVGLLQIGADERIVALDDAAEQVLGLGCRRLAGTAAADLVGPGYRALLEAALRRTEEGASWLQIAPVPVGDRFQPALLAGAAVSGTSPRIWACAVALLPDDIDRRVGPTDSAMAEQALAEDHCLVECTIEHRSDPGDWAPQVEARLRRALGTGPRIVIDGLRISVLLPAVGGAMAGLREADRVARLLRAIFDEHQVAVRTDLVCMGSPQGLLGLMDGH